MCCSAIQNTSIELSAMQPKTNRFDLKHWLACRAFSLKYSKAASLSENLDFLREILQKLGRGHHVVIFVLDEFDLFARKAKQTTLYNLLDAVQTAGVQVSQ